MNATLLHTDLNILLRSIISIVVLFIAARLMGKRQISQLTFFDYIVGITIGSIAGQLSIDRVIPYQEGLLSICIWSLVSIIIGKLNLINMKARRFFEGTAAILIQNGKIVEKNLKKEKVDINDLLEELRVKDVFDISSVEFAILETNGQISVQLKAENKPVTRNDLNLKPNYEGLCVNLIIDGEIMHKHLKIINRDEKWLYEQLKKKNISSTKDILLAFLDGNGNLHINVKDSNIQLFNVLD